jgi:hypothetical protein
MDVAGYVYCVSGFTVFGDTGMILFVGWGVKCRRIKSYGAGGRRKFILKKWQG